MASETVVRTSELLLQDGGHGDRFGYRRVKLGPLAGGDRLGCTLYEVPPGKSSCPYHFHMGNEEALYVLEGQALLRRPGGQQRIRAGDYVAFVRGPEGAHQLFNDSEAPMRFLILSTQHEPDVWIYPDSNKLGVSTGTGALARDPAWFPRTATVDYWAGESAARVKSPDGGSRPVSDPDAEIDRELEALRRKLEREAKLSPPPQAAQDPDASADDGDEVEALKARLREP